MPVVVIVLSRFIYVWKTKRESDKVYDRGRERERA